MEFAKENKLKKNIEKSTLIITMYLMLSIIYALPSVIYLLKNKTVYKFVYAFSSIFISTDSKLSNFMDMAIYLITFLALFILYFWILKNCRNIFKTKKKMFIFIAVVGVIFCLIIPQTSLDVYSYIGNAWDDFKHDENPYYVTVQDCIDKYGVSEMTGKVARVWKTEPVTYGPAWVLISKALVSISGGKITNALYIFKLASLLIYLGCTWLIYKITKKRFFVFAFALNPLILFEYLANVHNDLYMAFFILLAIYFVKNKKNLYLAVTALAIATIVKYVSILIVPFIVIYALKDNTLKNKIIKTIMCFIEFCIIIIPFYMIYIKDLQVFTGIFLQQTKYERSISLLIWYFLNQDDKIMSYIKIIFMMIFIIAYVTIILKLFFSKNISKFSDVIRPYQMFILLFTFALITNFNAWYFIWIIPTFMWQNSKSIRATFHLSIGLIMSYAVTYFTKIEDRQSGVLYFFIITLTTAVLTMIYKLKKENKYLYYKNINKEH